jgi:hypothetical protein
MTELFLRSGATIELHFLDGGVVVQLCPRVEGRHSYRAQLAFPSNAFVPLVQMSDLIFGLAILALRKKSNNLVVAARVLTTHVWPIIHNLSEAKIPS